MTPQEISGVYRSYIATLNARDWARLSEFVHPEAVHNGRHLGVDGYRRMLEADVDAIPDLQFKIEELVTEPPDLAARLRFDCRPSGNFLGLPVNGRRIQFNENVFYRYRDGLIAEVWSIVDKSAIESQL